MQGAFDFNIKLIYTAIQMLHQCFLSFNRICLLDCIKVLVTLILGVSFVLGEGEETASDKSKYFPLSGNFEIRIAGQPVGNETYEFKHEKGKPVLNSEVHLKLPGAQVKFSQSFKMESDDSPAGYVLTVQSGETVQTVLVNFTKKGVTATAGAPGTRVSEYFSADDYYILDNNLFSHYSLLIYRLRPELKDKIQFKAIVPQVLRLYEAELLYRGIQPVQWKGEKIGLHSAFLNLGEIVGINLYYDAHGELMKVVIPMQGAEAIRKDYQPETLPLPKSDIKDTGLSRVRVIKTTFHSGDITLAGTLTLPKGSEPPYPAFVLVSGSGPQDRNEDTPGGLGLQASFFKHLAYRLTQAGYAVLRYDDRGVGSSQGDFSSAGFSDFTSDARAAADYLKSRKDIDPKEVAMAGHSEGALIALKLASKKQSGLSRIVLLGCPAKALDAVLQEQILMLPDDGSKETVRQSQSELFRLVRETREDAAEINGVSINLKWYREHFEFDPSKAARRVRVPTLILQAKLDQQVLPEHAALLEASFHKGKAEVAMRILPGLDHLYLPSEKGDLGTYGDSARKYGEEPFASIIQWLKGEAVVLEETSMPTKPASD